MSGLNTPAELRAAYAYQFRGEAKYGFEWYRGWFPIAVQLCADVDALVRDDRFHRRFRWLQIKEKFGSARFYWDMRGLKRLPVVDIMDGGQVQTFEPVPPPGPDGDRAAARQIRELVKAAQEAAARTCLVCGAPGKLWQGRWMLTVCDEHTRTLARGEQLPNPGFSAAEGGVDAP